MAIKSWQARWAPVGACALSLALTPLACSVGDDESADSFVISAGTPSADGGDDGDSEDEVGETGTETETESETESESETTETGSTDESSGEDTTDASSESTDTGLPELPCAAKFDLIQPNPAVVGQPLTAQFTDDVGHVHIGMSATQLEGVGSPSAGNESITSDGPNGPFHWTYTITGHGEGIVELTFTANMQQNVLGNCRVHVVQ
ncbi:hypothetical protein [Plesiocystis pacifica]|uniref:hypothetical protein n=1 Tax=Plesiocystis pacifica TaxID=191768 RepID=UPI0005D47315|nr:hypothetical protein [Plesiocystis pacifica]